MKKRLLKVIYILFGIMVAIVLARIFIWLFIVALLFYGLIWATLKIAKA